MSVIPVILSGGSGTRLWPLSRKQYPKQLLNLAGGEYTMLQDTLKRVSHIDAPIIVCNEDHRFMVAEQCHSMGITPKSILLEPVARNTAPAIALAAYQALSFDQNAVIAVFPADHVITNAEAFQNALNIAIAEAQNNKLVTFGIVANKPETGFGYIKADKSAKGLAYHVEKFVEKPDLATAQQYIESGDYFWNSGMFVFKAEVYLKALEQSNPKITRACEKSLKLAKTDLDFIRVDKEAFKQSPDDSIDYAVFEDAAEQSNNVRVVPMDAGWSDLGSWSALWDILDKDKNANAFVGDVISINSNNNLVHSPKKLVATIGLENLVIVDTDDALLIANKDQVQDVKKVVGQLKKYQRDEHLQHREVHRPWGCYDSIDNGKRYQVKRITVKSGASLSLQMHYHRAEHWVVVSGSALVQVGEKEQLLTENQSVYIPIGETHRLTNPGKLPLELIEVQSGSYLGEDDIVRFEDVFGRC
ncbi:mannose-1-phosphate guanylyltransferase/mannose-6-phosphate isomerase [Thalassotalea piscium]|uniref:mannose-1-phosphate guanylyltransferase n=1 Tax=Thalassotalea piscium TaxID=1230533 RepID=A0A7X0NK09_9GAMM|nr:mannose-1-phosphate guanylyltransferase/mannose-6-phosphate isomerase [Thalassotalea piscium]MBB6544849.1 mannose-1-phosphate guanylyltransferase/mannose-6-phosphate isomerase [Thalassotalea piscium]